MTVLLFAGPSLHGTTVAIPPDVLPCPPAEAGDILRAIGRKPAAIALVDGVFATAASVQHKELLAALDAGIAVLGAASLGALRAAELCDFGMEGVGEIFADYRDGRIVRDDAVLVFHAPAELAYRPLTIALVDAEDSIRRAPLAPDDAALLLQIARRMPFHGRTWRAMLAAHPHGDALLPLLAPHLSSRKAADVDALLRRLGRPLAAPPAARRLRRTSYFRRLEARQRG